MTLRPYQQAAHDEVIAWMRRTTLPCVVDAATGAGKSHIIAEIAHTINRTYGKRILCIAPSKELVEQNLEKYELTGNKASIFSASIGQKSLEHPVVFGTPMTIKNAIEQFSDEFAVIVVDEAHGITPTIKAIIADIQNRNRLVRVVGLTATPYRMGTGYIYWTFEDGTAVPEEQVRDAYFEKCVYRITARELIDMGYLTPPTLGKSDVEKYHTLDMKLNSMGRFDQADVDQAFEGQGRKTSLILQDVVSQAYDRLGVLVFAATVEHAYECLESLPKGMSDIITGDTPKKEREDILARFRAKQIKYLVNVNVLTIGFDAPHVDLVAILRATESAGLLQQIIGRGLRLDTGKEDCLVLDYAENLERHCPEGRDIFDPTIRVARAPSGKKLSCLCPKCGKGNEFAIRPNPGKFKIDPFGYFIDGMGYRVKTEFGDEPAHFGRRCQTRIAGAHEIIRCDYRWTAKTCKHCGAENDIAARRCEKCEAELVDPNKKLRLDPNKRSSDPTKVRTDRVISWMVRPSVSKSGNETYRIDVLTPERGFAFWIMRHPKSGKQAAELDMFLRLHGQIPKTITYQKNKENDYYRVHAYNENEDEDSRQHSSIWGSDL